jgi:glutaredoxin-like protein NrdH
LKVGNERDKLVKEVKKYNPKTTFPTVVIDGGKTVIIGYKPEILEKELL